MKKNTVMIVLDSFSWLEFQYAKEIGIMPFLTDLEKTTIHADNVYSEGPHTEVGVRALLCGVDNLDNEGTYRFFSRCENTIFDDFCENGYIVKYIGAPWMYFSEKLTQRSNFSHIYTSVQKFKYIYRNRLEYFKEMYLKGTLSVNDQNMILNICDDMFDTLLIFWMNASKGKQIELINDRLENVDASYIFETIKETRDRYYANKWKEIEKIFAEADEYILSKVTDVVEKTEVFHSNKQYIDNKYREFMKTLKKRQVANNTIPPLYVLSNALFEHFKKKTTRQDIYTLSNWTRLKRSAANFDTEDGRLFRFPSIKKQLEYVSDELKKKDGQFIYLQPAELHFVNSWYSWDCSDKRTIDDEFRLAETTLKKTRRFERGFLHQTLALAYCDKCLRDFFALLDEQKLLKNTRIIITSDHGSSYGHGPIRNKMVSNNFHEENIHIPFIIYDDGAQGEIDQIGNSCDVMASVLDYCKIPAEKHKGESIFDENYATSIVSGEYLGPGFQDIYRKKIWFYAQNNNYKITYRIGLFEDFSKGCLEEIYDKRTDMLEMKNVVGQQYDKNEVNTLLEYLRKRHAEIKKQYGISDNII